MRLWGSVTIVLSGLLLQGCLTLAGGSTTGAPFPAGAWFSTYLQDHPLVGRIWEVETRRFVSSSYLVLRALDANYVLIGEKHDNVDHHRIQDWLVRTLYQGGRRPAVAFEMITADKASSMADYLARNPRDALGLANALDWPASGWPDWSNYQPIVQAALDVDAKVLAAGLPPAKVRAGVKQGLGAFEPAEVARYGLDRRLPRPLAAIQRAQIVIGHCRMLPEDLVDPIVEMQTMKDAYMAGVLIEGGRLGLGGAVLIAGDGHVRTDIGVPWHLNEADFARSRLSIGLIEVQQLDRTPEAYARYFGKVDLPFDFVWFTPRHDLTDPCETHGRDLKSGGNQGPGS